MYLDTSKLEVALKTPACVTYIKMAAFSVLVVEFMHHVKELNMKEWAGDVSLVRYW